MSNVKYDLPRLFRAKDTVGIDEGGSALLIIDQTLLPGEKVILRLTEIADIREAIKTLRVRGAPAIGVAAAIGLFLAADAVETEDFDSFTDAVSSAKAYLASSRPTAVNLFHALDRVERAARDSAVSADSFVAAAKRAMLDEAVKIRNEEIDASYNIGVNGLSLLFDGCKILTHCNAGRLATVRYGTALAPIHVGLERGMKFSVFADETRPLLQGARLTAAELLEAGADVTVICDNMAAQVMANGWVDAVITGADRIALNGDSCNKIGTLGVAILAKHYGIPFYIAAPLSTFDTAAKDGGGIPIERRDDDEITEMWYKTRMAPKGVRVYNPAFDVTPASLITAIITEREILKPPFDKAIASVIGSQAARGDVL